METRKDWLRFGLWCMDGDCIMHNRDEYRAKALEFLARADRTSRPEIREQLLRIAMAYVNLADFAERCASRDNLGDEPQRRALH
jgi:hypothetical protein